MYKGKGAVNMFDIFGGMFDIDSDGTLDAGERALECSFIEDIYEDDEDDDEDDEDDGADDDYDDSDDNEDDDYD
jgi:hypothetical protein